MSGNRGALRLHCMVEPSSGQSRCRLFVCNSDLRAWIRIIALKIRPGISSQGFCSLATGKHGCRKLRVYPGEWGEQLGKDPSKIGSSKSLVLKRFSQGGNTLGLVPSSRPSLSGIRLYFVRPHFPSPKQHSGTTAFLNPPNLCV